MEDKKFLVRVSCMTYNHAPYIVDAMNGFCMQETDFPFVCTIMDDASTDGEQEVIKKYLTDHFDLNDQTIVRNEETDDYVLTYARHKTNHNCFFAVYYLKYNHYSIKKSKVPYISEWQDNVKYIALCEGDDYWICPQKLQIQLDFLENHNDYSLCGTNGIVFWDSLTKAPSYFNTIIQDRAINIDEIINKWIFPTASLVYRKTIIHNYPSWTKKIFMGDQTLTLIASHLGKVYAMKNITCFYRKSIKNTDSASSRIKSKGPDYIINQIILLLKEFDNWTEHKYQQPISIRIKYLQKKENFLKVHHSCKYLAYMRFPIFSLKERLMH